ncbi:uncharacterized protein LOC126900852 [Daktulosphaira vitifoliae]|uniref:uncharacterized protein LOC126900852 n=1 Tax=Daktulosphaira vitifoliae TaxID=58002 RepID=UPI0021AA14D5|nr:uncharacterized protein LOC126900852 [Daktulosphaira vitifoliae]XP_050532790.1 uncharacterized protein LOC126900852 [Daktulosphaira vitifoliae]
MSGSIPLGLYVKYSFMALVSMMVGSQIVHNHFKPLDDLEDYVEREFEKLKNDKNN